jgi:PAS domain S-box-containing protein
MLRVPVASNDAAPPPPAGAENAAPAGRRKVALAILAMGCGLGTVGGLLVVLAAPALAPVLGPFAIFAIAFALWGAAHADHRRLAAELDRLAGENARLATRLESLADTAWELRESEERYRSLIEAEGDVVVHRDRDGNVTFVNAAFTETFGLARDRVLGLPLALSPLAEVAGTTTRDAGERDIVARDIRLATRSGPRWYSWVDIRVRDEKGALGPVYSVARDIDARKETERTLRDASKRAEAASQAKSGFLAAVSHEFRTPLNGILGLTGLLLESDLPADQETYARGVRSSGEALLRLVDDMLDFSRIEAGRLDLRPETADIEALLQEIGELLAGRAHAKAIDLAVAPGLDLPGVLVDGPRLRQVLINLVGNGIKFTDAGGVTLRAKRSADPDGRTVRIGFSVEDSGPGIDPAEAERIFGEFEQIDSAPNRRHGGAGLGLAISRRIVRHMGGDIVLSPRPGGGSIFSFSLDLPLVGDAVEAPSRALAGRSIMVLASGTTEPSVLIEDLMAAGASIRLVHDAVAAAALAGAAAAAALPYDAVLIDQRIAPDPVAALSRLRAAAGRMLPAAVLIEPAGRSRIESLREAGFDAYLVRPVRRSSLLRIVGDIIGAKGGFRPDPEDLRPRASRIPARAPARLKILLVEDNEINALLARAVLEGLGHAVTEVRDGAAAVDAVTGSEEHFAAILMDLHMPGIDGIAASRIIRNFERRLGRPRAAIMALTADVLAETRAEAAAAGIDAVLEKPIAPERLRRMLAEIAPQPVGSSAA